MIKNQQQAYINARQRSVKTHIISEIIREVREQQPPGRFVKFDDRIKLWFEVDEKEVKKKTSQTLREGAPQWRKSHGEWKRRENEPMPSIDGNANANVNAEMEVDANANANGQEGKKRPHEDNNTPLAINLDNLPSAKKARSAAGSPNSDQNKSGLDLLTDAIFTLGGPKNKAKAAEEKAVTSAPPPASVTITVPASSSLDASIPPTNAKDSSSSTSISISMSSSIIISIRISISSCLSSSSSIFSITISISMNIRVGIVQ